MGVRCLPAFCVRALKISPLKAQGWRVLRVGEGKVRVLGGGDGSSERSQGLSPLPHPGPQTSSSLFLNCTH